MVVCCLSGCRRAGRFDREISLGIPTEAAREQILRVITRPLRLRGGFDYATIARRTPGFVGADLAALAKEAAAAAVTRIFARLTQDEEDEQHRQQQQQEQAGGGSVTPAITAAAAAAAAAGGEVAAAVGTTAGALATPAAVGSGSGRGRLGAGPLTPTELSGLAITMADWEVALPKVQPSVRREGFTTKPDVTWEDVGALDEVRGGYQSGIPGRFDRPTKKVGDWNEHKD